MNLVIGNVAGSLGETSGLLILIGGAYMWFRRSFDWRIPVSILVAAAALSGALYAANPVQYPSPWFTIFSGSLLFGAVYMATDPVTSPLSPKGAWIFGAGIGLLVVLIRVFGGLSEGVMYAILLMNAASPLIERWTQPRVFGHGGRGKMSEDMQAKGAETQDASEPSSARLILTLSMAGLISGLILVGAYELTLPRIIANQARELREAVFKVLPGVESFEPMAFIGDKLQVVEEKETRETDLCRLRRPRQFRRLCYSRRRVGFQDAIKLIYGFQPSGRIIVGMEVLESKETPGLGDKIIKDPAFKENFTELAVDPEVVPVPTGTRAHPTKSTRSPAPPSPRRR